MHLGVAESRQVNSRSPLEGGTISKELATVPGRIKEIATGLKSSPITGALWKESKRVKVTLNNMQAEHVKTDTHAASNNPSFNHSVSQ